MLARKTRDFLMWKSTQNACKIGGCLNPIDGDILGCGLAHFTKGSKPDRRKNRLYRILVSEAAYLVWKTKNERRIESEDSTGREITDSGVYNRWNHAISKKQTIALS